MDSSQHKVEATNFFEYSPVIAWATASRLGGGRVLFRAKGPFEKVPVWMPELHVLKP